MRTLIILALLPVLTLQPGHAQTASPNAKNTPAAPAATRGGWEFFVAPYFIAAGMDGKIQIADATVPVDVGFSDILENLELGGMLHLVSLSDTLGCTRSSPGPQRRCQAVPNETRQAAR